MLQIYLIQLGSPLEPPSIKRNSPPKFR